jgi:hypothetical protein
VRAVIGIVCPSIHLGWPSRRIRVELIALGMISGCIGNVPSALGNALIGISARIFVIFPGFGQPRSGVCRSDDHGETFIPSAKLKSLGSPRIFRNAIVAAPCDYGLTPALTAQYAITQQSPVQRSLQIIQLARGSHSRGHAPG